MFPILNEYWLEMLAGFQPIGNFLLRTSYLSTPSLSLTLAPNVLISFLSIRQAGPSCLLLVISI